MGFFGIALVAAPALGPILGGWLVDLGHWRWIFYLNVPIALLGTLLGSRWLPAPADARTARFDPLGLLFSIGFGNMLYAASRAAELGWTAPAVTRFFMIELGPIRAFCSEYTQGLGNAYTFTFYASLVAPALGAMLPGWPGRVRARGAAEVGLGH